VFVGGRVCLGWLWIITHRGGEGGVVMGMGIELVEIMILLGRRLGLRWVKGKLGREIVVGMRGVLLLLMLVVVRGR